MAVDGKVALEVPYGQIRDQLERMKGSEVFTSSRQSWRLLEYLCKKLLLDQAHEIKESTIAVELYGRTPDFDEKKDSIVRVEAHRLRKRLQRFYESEGADEPVRIDLAPGGYIPRLIEQEKHARADDLRTIPPAAALIQQPDRTIHKRIALLVLVVLLGLLSIAGIKLAKSSHSVALTEKTPSAILPVSANAPSASAAGSDIRILAGSTSSYTDRQGHLWQADRFYSGGSAQRGPKEFFGKPADAGLFKNMRIGEFSYAIPAPPGTYELRLYFVEPAFRNSAEVEQGDGENERFFNVAVNGQLALQNFDIVSDSGFAPTDVRALRDVRPGPDGLIRLRFDPVHGAPVINAIELLRCPDGQIPPIRLRAAELSFTDRTGRTWSPDDFFIGGKLATHKQDVTGTDTPDVYASERFGNFEYALPVPPGRYAVTLHFAETWWQSDEAGTGGAGYRIFDVSCNSHLLLHNFDMIRAAGPLHAIDRTFHDLEPNGQGKLLLAFTPVRNYASVKAIEVEEEH